MESVEQKCADCGSQEFETGADGYTYCVMCGLVQQAQVIDSVLVPRTRITSHIRTPEDSEEGCCV